MATRLQQTGTSATSKGRKFRLPTEIKPIIKEPLGANAGTGVLPDNTAQDPSGTPIPTPQPPVDILANLENGTGVRKEPTVATPQKPLVTVGGTVDNFSSLSDDEKDDQILLKLSKEEALTDEERMFKIKQFKAKQNVTQDSLGLAGVGDEIKGQISGLEDDLNIRAGEQKTEREKLIAQKQRELDTLLGREEVQLRQSGNREQDAAGTRLSFSGFGRSTFAADQAGQIQKRVEQSVEAVRRANDLELSLFKRQLEGADAESLQADRDAINNLKSQARQFELDSAKEVARLNAENSLNFEESFSNMLQTLTPESQKKFDKDASAALGFASDEFGNALFTDENGEPIPLPKDEEGIKWGRYEDRFGNTVFFDESDPTNTMRPNRAKTFEQPDGSVGSSPTSDASGMQTEGSGAEYIRDDGTTGLLGENCVKYARTIVPNLPFGLVSKEDKVNAINFAEKEGFGSTNANLAQVGDAILTKEGSWGHAAVIKGIDPETGEFILEEANYKSGQVTNGRRIDPNDPLIIGMVSNSAQPQMSSAINELDENGQGEGQTASVGSQVMIEATDIPEVDFSASQAAEFLKYEKDPNFIPKSVGNEQELEQFYNEYEVFKKQSDNKPIKLDPSDEFNFTKDLRKEFNALVKDPKKAIVQIGLIRTSFDDAKKRVARGDSINASSQGILVPFQKMLDPTSVVRESEYARSGDGQSLLKNIEGKYQRIKQGGAGVTVEGLQEFFDTAELFMAQYENSIIEEARPFMNESKRYGLDDNSIFGADVMKLIKRGRQEVGGSTGFEDQLQEGEVLIEDADGNIVAVTESEILPTDKRL